MAAGREPMPVFPIRICVADMKIVADDKIPYLRGVLEPYVDMAYLPGGVIAASDLTDADALLVRTRTRCDAGLLSESSVRLVATATIGTDHIDMHWCAGRGIDVVSAPGCNAGGVLQWVAAVLREETVRRGSVPGELTVGVVGIGHVGSLVGDYASDWGFRVLRSDPPREEAEGLGPDQGYVPLEELAARADIVTFHVPMVCGGAHPTVGLGGDAFFRALRRGAAVLNSSRGGIVDERLLSEAVAEGRCSACIDTWSGEPGINQELLTLATIATPHIAGYSLQGKANATAAVVAAVAGHFGLPLSGWYPSGVTPVCHRKIGWREMCDAMPRYFDISGQTAALKASPERFEKFREEYAFRQEFF